MFQDEALREFFEWLLDRDNVPEPRGTARRFVPKIDNEIQRLKELDKSGCPGLREIIERLEELRGVVAKMGYEFRSKRMQFTSQESKNTALEAKLYAATCVAAALWPEASPHEYVWKKMKETGHHRGQRTHEIRVRRFIADTTPEHRLMVLRWEYMLFRHCSILRERKKAELAGWRPEDWERIRRLETEPENEIAILEELRANFEVRKAQTNTSRGGRKKSTITVLQ